MVDMNRRAFFLCLFAFVLPAFFGFSGCEQQKVPEVSLPYVQDSANSMGLAIDPCSGKQRCVLVYVAPWCPACKVAIGFIKQLREYLSRANKVGLQVVVGLDKEESLRNMAESIGGVVYIDREGRMKRAAGIGGIPSWVVWNWERKVVARTAGAPSGGPGDGVVKWFMSEELGLGEYL